MAPNGQRGSYEEDPVYRRADGEDPARRRCRTSCGGGEEARDLDGSDLRVAQAFRATRDHGREAAAPARAGKREAEETGRRAGPRARCHEGDQPKKMVGACARRSQVMYAHARGIPYRRACGLLSVARSALRYESRLAAKDAPIVTHMRELSAQYPRFGYRRIQVFLERLGYPMSPD